MKGLIILQKESLLGMSWFCDLKLAIDLLQLKLLIENDVFTDFSTKHFAEINRNTKKSFKIHTKLISEIYFV